MNLCIIQARLGSSRFPRKILADIEGKTMIQRVVDRVNLAKKIDKVVVAIPEEDKKDFPEVQGAKVIAVHGDPNDVLLRYNATLNHYNHGGEVANIVRITGDCPLICPAQIDEALWMHEKFNADFTTNRPGYPDGMDVEVITRKVFRLLMYKALSPDEHEHVTLYFYNNPDEFKLIRVSSDRIYPAGLKLSVDTRDDLEIARRVYQTHKDGFGLTDIMSLLHAL